MKPLRPRDPANLNRARFSSFLSSRTSISFGKLIRGDTLTSPKHHQFCTSAQVNSSRYDCGDDWNARCRNSLDLGISCCYISICTRRKSLPPPPKKSQTRGATSALESEQEECGSVTNLTQEADLEPSKPH